MAVAHYTVQNIDKEGDARMRVHKVYNNNWLLHANYLATRDHYDDGSRRPAGHGDDTVTQ